MAEKSAWETVRLQGEQIVDEARRIIHEGNVRRVVVRQRGEIVAEFPLTVGVVASVIAPVLAAIAAFVGFLADCSVDLERRKPAKVRKAGSRKAAPRKKAARKKTTRAKKTGSSRASR